MCSSSSLLQSSGQPPVAALVLHRGPSGLETCRRAPAAGWLAGCLAAVCLLSSCESNTKRSSESALDRRMRAIEYQRSREACEGLPVFPGMTPIWGLGIGSNIEGLQPFYDPSVLYRLPQSR